MNRKVIVLGTMVFVSVGAFPLGTLQIGEPTVEGNQVVIPVILGGDVRSGVSALDFRLNYNPEALQPVSASAGVVASRADKQVMANMTSPGEYIVVMMGMNQATCNSGEVVRVVMERLGNEPETDWDLGLARQTLSSIDGTVIDSEALPYRSAVEPVSIPEKSVDTPGPSNRDQSGEPKRTEDSRKLPGFGLEAVASTRSAAKEAIPSQVIVSGDEAADESQARLKAAVAAKDQARGATDASAPLRGEARGDRDEDLVAETTKSEFGKSQFGSDSRETSSTAGDVMNMASAMDGPRTVERNYTNASNATPSEPVQGKTSTAPLTRIAVGVGIGVALAAAILFGLRRRRLG